MWYSRQNFQFQPSKDLLVKVSAMRAAGPLLPFPLCVADRQSDAVLVIAEASRNML